ncbi:hypothetical protein BV006_00854 [Haemophilus influenzae]|uniref:hypothetical protein n=1 Tax=Haemophilus influenzae TaxID=727 RepID=UPI000D00CCD8|nr:hypothetical protein [Haemophilus influenzae]AWP53378.1 hypothetical protein DLJ98_00335 [Haemophilus influenzae]PRI39526.1 hypothetical protein BVZ56_00987 [Haemophilus influenzae]PRJ55593.1 hypothetical protein BV097_00643 [Haemophilus influenzae]PRJ56665.1 hypothetical protein BV094_01477 [Haemophilus influenzae]PRJ95775.1 hypothetical protein BV166_00763 [Haemophilus influenzae]
MSKYEIVDYFIEIKLNENGKEYVVLILETDNKQLIYELFVDNVYKSINQLEESLEGLNKSISSMKKIEINEYLERSYIIIRHLDDIHKFSGRRVR